MDKMSAHMFSAYLHAQTIPNVHRLFDSTSHPHPQIYIYFCQSVTGQQHNFSKVIENNKVNFMFLTSMQ
jgi:hypothetical protein